MPTMQQLEKVIDTGSAWIDHLKKQNKEILSPIMDIIAQTQKYIPIADLNTARAEEDRVELEARIGDSQRALDADAVEGKKTAAGTKFLDAVAALDFKPRGETK